MINNPVVSSAGGGQSFAKGLSLVIAWYTTSMEKTSYRYPDLAKKRLLQLRTALFI